MKELDLLIDYCYNQYNGINCGECANNSFCETNGCSNGWCHSCLDHILHSQLPTFHYPCERITYYYTLRFFARFVSEIKRLFTYCKNVKRDLSIVSLGCGPGSELYGIIDGVRIILGNDFNLTYRGYDSDKIWHNIQVQTELIFQESNCDVKFSDKDMFSTYDDYQKGSIDAFVMNYLLSDCQKYAENKESLIEFLDAIVEYIVNFEIPIVIFNDINFYGYADFDSGVKCMNYITSRLELLTKKVETYKMCYPEDSFIPKGWKLWGDNNILVTTDLKKTGIANPWTKCRSKYIISRITY